MRNIYLVRHGESMGQIDKEVCGINPVLSPEGERQAKSLQTRLKGLDVDTVYLSPLNRAYQTYLLSKFKSAEKTKYDKRLIEREWLGTPYPEDTFDNLPKIAEPDHQDISGLTFNQRIESFYEDIIIKGDTDICIFSHYGTSELLVQLFFNMTPEQKAYFRLQNTHICHLQIDGGGRKIVCGLNLKHIVPELNSKKIVVREP